MTRCLPAFALRPPKEKSDRLLMWKYAWRSYYAFDFGYNAKVDINHTFSRPAFETRHYEHPDYSQ